MIHLYYSDGAARIVVLQLNWSMTLKSMRGLSDASATSADPAKQG